MFQSISVAAFAVIAGVAVAAPATAAPKPMLEGWWTCTGKLTNGGGEQQMIISGADTPQQAVDLARQTYSDWTNISCVPQQ